MRSISIDKFARSILPSALVGVGTLSFLISILMLVMPIYMMTLIGKVLTSQSMSSLWGLTIISIFLLVIHGVLVSIRGRILSRVGENFDHAIRDQVFQAMIHQNSMSGRTSNSLQSLDVVKRFLSNDAVSSFFDVPFVPLFLIVIYLLSPTLGLIALLCTLLMLVSTWLTDRRAKKKKNTAKSQTQVAQLLVEEFSAQAETLKVNGMISRAFRKWQTLRNEAVSDEMSTSDAMSDSQAVLRTGMFLFPVFLLCAGAILVLQGELGVGALVAVNILMMRAVAPLQSALVGWKLFVDARASFDNLNTFLLEYEDYSSHIQATLPVPSGNILVEGLISKPPGKNSEPILKGLSFKVTPGESVGLVGASGAGKTTLLKHIAGLAIPLKGHVKFDGIQSWQWSSDFLGEHIGYMAQESELFEGTIAENISRLKTCDIAEVVAAAELAGVHHRIAQLPQGYDTVVAGGKATLSGGERQAVCLARAVFRSPKIVLLDEPTASMDALGQTAVKTCITNLTHAGITVIVSSHNMEVLKSMDKLLMIQFGRQIAYGTPDEVAAKTHGGAGSK
mgnify:CR=1 FL=1